jgi:hypothetical protein
MTQPRVDRKTDYHQVCHHLCTHAWVKKAGAERGLRTGFREEEKSIGLVFTMCQGFVTLIIYSIILRN